LKTSEKFECVRSALPDVVFINIRRFEDERGYLTVPYHRAEFEEIGIPTHFEQDIHSCSNRGVIRGLHFQGQPPMGKLMRVTRGAAYLVAVDIRKYSPTVGKWVGAVFDAEIDGYMMWAPGGFARGFLALTDNTEVQYKCTSLQNPATEVSIRYDDSDIGIDWDTWLAKGEPILSEKDKNAISLSSWLNSKEAENVHGV